MRKRWFILLLCNILLIICSSSLADSVVVGQVFLPETETCVITTRQDYATLPYTGGMALSDLKKAYEDNESLIAYVIYPFGPSLTVSDYPATESSEDVQNSGNVVKDYWGGLDDYMLSIGYTTSKTETVAINGFDFVLNQTTLEDHAARGYYIYYSDPEGNTRVVNFDFFDFENIPVWNSYIDRYMQMVSFKPGTIPFGTRVYSTL